MRRLFDSVEFMSPTLALDNIVTSDILQLIFFKVYK